MRRVRGESVGETELEALRVDATRAVLEQHGERATDRLVAAQHLGRVRRGAFKPRGLDPVQVGVCCHVRPAAAAAGVGEGMVVGADPLRQRPFRIYNRDQRRVVAGARLFARVALAVGGVWVPLALVSREVAGWSLGIGPAAVIGSTLFLGAREAGTPHEAARGGNP